MKKKTIYVDIDGFLCTDKQGFYRKVKLIMKNIEKVNKAYNEGHIIVIWTARGKTTNVDWKDLTIQQLKKWGVKYHQLSFNKPFFDEIWDDKAKL